MNVTHCTCVRSREREGRGGERRGKERGWRVEQGEEGERRVRGDGDRGRRRMERSR